MLRKRLLSGALVLTLCFGCAQAVVLDPEYIPIEGCKGDRRSRETAFSSSNSMLPLIYTTKGYDQRVNFVNQWGELMDSEGYEEAGHFSEGLAFVQKGDMVGFIDMTGAMVLSLPMIYGSNGSYFTHGDFHAGLAYVEWAESTYTFSELLEAAETEEEFDALFDFVNSKYVSVGLDEIYLGPCFIDRSGNIAFLCTEMPPLDLNFSDDGLMFASETWTWDGPFGYLDRSGEWAIEPQFDTAFSFEHGYAVVEKEDQYAVIDTNGDFVIPYSDGWITPVDWIGHEEPLFVVPQHSSDPDRARFPNKLYDGTGTCILESQENWTLLPNVPIPSDGPFPVTYYIYEYSPQKVGLVDLEGNELSGGIYYDTGLFYSEGLLQVQMEEGGPWKYIDEDLNDVILLPPEYSYGRPSPFIDGIASVMDAEGNQYKIDRTGEIVFSGIPYFYDNQANAAFYEGVCRGFGSTEETEGEQAIILDPRMKDAVSSWALDGVEEAKASGLVTESNDAYFGFRITRRRFAELAANLVEQVTGQEITPLPEGHFRDTDDIWVRKAAALGLVNGIDDGNCFSPNGYISREQLSAVLYRTITYLEEQTGTEVLTSAGDLSAYSDGDQVSSWARESVAALCAAGILQGTSDTTLSPKDTTTVEQAILLTLRAYQLF